MQLPVEPPFSPMPAKAVSEIPPDASYEPKWDGFQSICFRDGDEVQLGSRNERPLTRYFPELVAAATAELPQRCVIDGEIVIAGERGLDLDALQLRAPRRLTGAHARREDAGLVHPPWCIGGH